MDGRTQHRACPQCDKPLRDEQKTYCSKACRIEGMRAAKSQQKWIKEQQQKYAEKPDKGDDWYQPESYTEPAPIGDWRRPKADADAMQSYHRRPPG